MVKNKKTHDAELFCRRVIAENPGAVEKANTFRKVRADFGDNWPDWCYLPMAAVYAIITNVATAEDAKRIMIESGVYRLAELTAAIIWMRSKVIFSFDHTLSDILMEQPLDSDIPTHIIERLPYQAVYIERDIQTPNEKYKGFFAWLEWDVNNRQQELRLLFLSSDTHAESVPILMTEGTIDNSLLALISSGAARASDILQHPDAQYLLGIIQSDAASASPFPPTNILAGCINHLLYLCSDDPDMPNQQLLKDRRAYDSAGAAKRPATVDVGYRIGAAIRKASIPAQTGKSNMHISHNSPAPHMRRGHWHHFWTGSRTVPGNRKLVLKWLPPIPVNVDDGGGEVSAVIYSIKNH